MCLIHLFINLFDKYLLAACHVPNSVLGAEAMVVGKAETLIPNVQSTLQ